MPHDHRGDCPEPLGPVTEALGAPDQYRCWCSAAEFPLNDFRRIEFCGWLIGWGDAMLETPVGEFHFAGSSGPATRMEVHVFLTTDGEIVSAVDLISQADRAFASSPPDLWATFLGKHDALQPCSGWLRSVEQQVSPSAEWKAVTDALCRARSALAGIQGPVGAVEG